MNSLCRFCGAELRPEQQWRGGKYCSRRCYWAFLRTSEGREQLRRAGDAGRAAQRWWRRAPSGLGRASGGGAHRRRRRGS